jgi:hypothetical protein
MASNQHQHDEQLRFLQDCYPQDSKHYLLRLLRKYDGDVDQVYFLKIYTYILSPLTPPYAGEWRLSIYIGVKKIEHLFMHNNVYL